MEWLASTTPWNLLVVVCVLHVDISRRNKVPLRNLRFRSVEDAPDRAHGLE